MLCTTERKTHVEKGENSLDFDFGFGFDSEFSVISSTQVNEQLSF